MWLHYSATTIDYQPRNYKQARGLHELLHCYSKPIGFWITDDSDSCWKTWCKGEKWNVEGLTYKYKITLDEKKILILRSATDILQFTNKWENKNSLKGERFNNYIDWNGIAENYDGIIITPYQWCLRLKLDWYYPWDCASGCIWQSRAIKDVKLLNKPRRNRS